MDFKLDPDDKRSNIRVDFKAPVRVSFPESKELVNGVLLNLSVSGMLVDLQDGANNDVSELKGKCIAEILFTGSGSRLRIDQLQSTVSRIDNNRIALEFKATSVSRNNS